MEVGAVLTSGSMLVAVVIAIAAGVVSFASPCVLPLAPGYLAYLSGMSAASVSPSLAQRFQSAPSIEASETGSATKKTSPDAVARRRLLLGVLGFICGFSVIFILYGGLIGGVGGLLREHQETMVRIMGVLVIVMGLAFAGALPFFQQEKRLNITPRTGLWGAPVLGFVFGFGWVPCLGPALIAVYSLSLNEGTVTRGLILAVAYCIGLGLPFLLLALGLVNSTRALDFLRRHRVLLMRVGGGLLVLIGVALVTGWWATWTGQLQSLIQNFRPVL